FVLAEHVGAGEVRQLRRRQHRRAQHLTSKRLRGSFDIPQRNHSVITPLACQPDFAPMIPTSSAPGERRTPAMVAEPNRSPIDVRPNAYDPIANPELFDGVLACRVFAFIIDVLIIALPVMGTAMFIFLLGFLTFGLGWLLLWPLHAVAVIWALLYYGFTLGGPASATLGMRVMDIEMRTSYGAPCYFV